MGRLVKGDDFSKRIVLSLLLFVLLFIIVCLVIFIIKGHEPSTLIHSVFALIAVEFWVLSSIKKSRLRNDTIEKVSECGSDGLEMGKEIIKQEGQRWNL